MIAQLTVQEYEKEDAEVLPPLYKVLSYSVEKDELQSRLRYILANPAYGCLVAEKESQILGFIGYAKRYFFEATGFYYRILALAVSRNARRQGIATALMDKVKKIASQDGANDERLAAYAQNYGFRQTSLAFARNVEENEHGKEKS
ncbi:GNAT family N-acetyltransferase [Streptococcus sp. DTU_2020_1000888_1_SI_GRL_NUU_041A]|jgi:acetyltransferase, GNAT family, putative|uniref:GNAT family N-acetyltransferase n=1 Tax=Streptococcus sp. DTU_2020_1000888_1_SI_GRL_NUU_041A TaxID=3077723 RepID=UPI0028E30611|nr:GNAT family N-acetyltransferase [Streptococcus sp. DTU_2020_1000888_1_SI_GRL_NUU_041A]WNU95729.1 GNAT family N-acetyltransferase [Streptococcus sp. DTU_2020_1000888_1_SI_GRL_NUU_041A]